MDIVEAFRMWRSYLFTVAYNITGDRQGAEDVVQDCFEALLESPREGVRNPKSYLTRVVVHKSVDRLEKRKKETYVGHWMPEPLLSIDAPAVQDAVSYPLLHALETLNPPERAVFLLREGFGIPYEEVAEVCDTTPENCRQLLHRAKSRIRRHGPSVEGGEPQAPDARPQVEVLRAFLDACRAEDPDALTHLLKEDITIYADGGGKRQAILEPLTGAYPVAKFIRAVIHNVARLGLSVHDVYVNGRPGVLFLNGDQIDTVLTIAVTGGQVSDCYLVRNPEKIYSSVPVTK